jgi:hypothetical protein
MPEQVPRAVKVEHFTDGEAPILVMEEMQPDGSAMLVSVIAERRAVIQVHYCICRRLLLVILNLDPPKIFATDRRVGDGKTP